MINKRLFVWVVLPALLMGTAAHGSIWLCDFSTMTGTNADAVAPYTDMLGGQANQYTVTYAEAPGNDPWLYKSANDTVVFDNQGTGGRARFQTDPQASFNLDTGIGIAYRLRVSDINCHARSQISIRANTATDGAFGAWVRVRNADLNEDGNVTGIIDIGRENSGESYHHDRHGDESIDWLILDHDMTDVWGQYTLTGIYMGKQAYGAEQRGVTYWQLSLDGEVLQFDGPSGGLNIPEVAGYEGVDWSFRLFSGFASGGTRLKMNHMIAGLPWFSEFDYLNYTDEGIVSAGWVPEPASLLLLAFGTVFLRRRRS